MISRNCFKCGAVFFETSFGAKGDDQCDDCLNKITFEKVASVRNHAPSGWIMRVGGKIEGPVFKSRKEAAGYAACRGLV